MKVILGSDICVYIIRNKPPGLHRHLDALASGEVGVSAITVAELRYGAAKSAARKRNEEALSKFLAPLEVVDFDEAASAIYGEIRAALEKKGTPIGPMDLLIAAQALSGGCTLVTNNPREFRRVPGLRCVNWV